jgi:hypothetical protein
MLPRNATIYSSVLVLVSSAVYEDEHEKDDEDDPYR